MAVLFDDPALVVVSAPVVGSSDHDKSRPIAGTTFQKHTMVMN